MMTIGDRIASIRKTAKNGSKMTLDDFGARIGIKGPSVSLLESGKNQPSDQTIMMICREFNINEEWLRNGTGEMFVQRSRDEEIAAWIGGIQAIESDSFKKRFISMLSKLDESEWEVLEKMAITLLKEKD